jgi:hypothetical protein
MTFEGNGLAGQSSLELHLEVSSPSPRPAGTVVLVNTGNQDVRLWHTGNSWGDTVLSFEMIRNEKVWRLLRQEHEYTRNVPSSFRLPAGDRHEWAFDLGDGEWEAEASAEQLAVLGARLVAVYDVPRTP